MTGRKIVGIRRLDFAVNWKDPRENSHNVKYGLISGEMVWAHQKKEKHLSESWHPRAKAWFSQALWDSFQKEPLYKRYYYSWSEGCPIFSANCQHQVHAVPENMMCIYIYMHYIYIYVKRGFKKTIELQYLDHLPHLSHMHPQQKLPPRCPWVSWRFFKLVMGDHQNSQYFVCFF